MTPFNKNPAQRAGEQLAQQSRQHVGDAMRAQQARQMQSLNNHMKAGYYVQTRANLRKKLAAGAPASPELFPAQRTDWPRGNVPLPSEPRAPGQEAGAARPGALGRTEIHHVEIAPDSRSPSGWLARLRQGRGLLVRVFCVQVPNGLGVNERYLQSVRVGVECWKGSMKIAVAQSEAQRLLGVARVPQPVTVFVPYSSLGLQGGSYLIRLHTVIRDLQGTLVAGCPDNEVDIFV